MQAFQTHFCELGIPSGRCASCAATLPHRRPVRTYRRRSSLACSALLRNPIATRKPLHAALCRNAHSRRELPRRAQIGFLYSRQIDAAC